MITVEITNLKILKHNPFPASTAQQLLTIRTVLFFTL